MAQKGNKFRIGILARMDISYHQFMASSINFAFCNQAPNEYECIIYRVSLHRDAVQEQVKTIILDGACDVIVPIGELNFYFALQASREVGGIPIAFMGVRNPTGPGGIKSMEEPGSTITGVLRTPATASKMAHHIAKLYPDISSIMIPYSPAAPRLEAEVTELKEILSSIGMQIFLAPIKETEISVGETIKSCEGKVQAVCLIEGCASNLYQEEIAYECWKKCILTIGSSSFAIDAGFSCAFAGDLTLMVAELVRRVRRYCEDSIALGSAPIAVLPDDRDFVVNIDMFRRIDFPSESLKRICVDNDTKIIRKWVNVDKKFLR